MNLFRCLHARELTATGALFVVFTSLWIAGYEGFVGWTSFLLVALVLAEQRRR